METVRVLINRLPHAEGLPLPRRMSEHAAGFDLVAAVGSEVVIQPGQRALVPTGYKIAVPAGYEAQVRPRSGLALKSGVTVLNSPGTIDADYRGEVKVILANLGELPFTVNRGDRVAQLIVSRVPRVIMEECSQLPETERGEGGFGHTGD
jgi:dUTP pyrophosphatase